VNNSNFVAISHRLRDMSGQSPKIHSAPGGVRGGVSTFPKKSLAVAGGSSILPPEFHNSKNGVGLINSSTLFVIFTTDRVVATLFARQP